MSEDIKLSKDIQLNSHALMKNLEIAEKKLKKGAKIDEALTEMDLAWHRMPQGQRDHFRDKLHPRPTREYTRELSRLIKKYGSVQDAGAENRRK